MGLSENDLPLLKRAVREVMDERDAETSRKQQEEQAKVSMLEESRNQQAVRAFRNGIVYGVVGAAVAITYFATLGERPTDGVMIGAVSASSLASGAVGLALGQQINRVIFAPFRRIKGTPQN